MPAIAVRAADVGLGVVANHVNAVNLHSDTVYVRYKRMYHIKVLINKYKQHIAHNILTLGASLFKVTYRAFASVAMLLLALGKHTLQYNLRVSKHHQFNKFQCA